MRQVLIGLVVSGGLLLAGCGGGDVPADGEAATGGPAAALTTPASTEAPQSTVPSSTAPSSTAPSSTAPSSTAPPHRPEGGALEPGKEYRVGDTVGDLVVSFRSPDRGNLSLDYGPDQFGLYRDDQPETVTALWVTATDRLNIAEIDPPTGAPVGRSELPDDLLRWLQERPFLETIEPPRPISVGDAQGEMMVTRTTRLPTATDPSFCTMGGSYTAADPAASVDGCAAIFVDDQGGPWTTFPGTVTEFALLQLGASEVLVVTERLADDARPTLLGDLRITESA